MNNPSDFERANFWRTAVGYMVGSFSNMLISIGLSIYVYAETDSEALAGLMIAANFLPMFLVVLFASPLADSYEPRYILTTAEIGAALFSLLFLFLPEGVLWPLFVICFFRSCFSQVTSMMRSVVVRVCFETDAAKRHYPTIATIHKVGIAIAGLAASLGLKYLGFTYLVVLDVVTFIIAAIAFSGLKTVAHRDNKFEWSDMRPRSTFRSFGMIARSPVLLGSFVTASFGAAILNGNGHVYFSILPMAEWDMKELGVGLFFLAQGLGTYLGGIVHSRWDNAGLLKPIVSKNYLLVIAALGVLCSVSGWTHPYVALGLMVIVTALGQMFILRYAVQVMALAPVEHIGRISSLDAAIRWAGSAVVAYGVSWVAQLHGVEIGNVVGCSAALLLSIWVVAKYSSRTSEVVGGVVQQQA